MLQRFAPQGTLQAAPGYRLTEVRIPEMPTVAYKVAPDGEKWLVTRNGEPGMSYVSQEAAYEVATAEAAGDLRTGNEIRIEVLGSAYRRAGDGSRTSVEDGRPNA
jgi:hypothetical protein